MVDNYGITRDYAECYPGDSLIGPLMRGGGWIYRKSNAGTVLIVPNGGHHYAAWRAMWEDAQ